MVDTVKILVGIAHVVPTLVLLLMAVWMGSVLTSYSTVDGVVQANEMHGFAWAKGEAKVFNWHPLLMTFGFIFCSSQAALAYVSLPFTHDVNKKIHMTLHGIGAVSAVIGAVAVFRFHNEHNITNLYSLHSWLGLLTVIMFVGMYIFAFTVFYYPGASAYNRANIKPLHIGYGLSIVGLILLTSATGVLEKLSFNGSCNISGNLDGNQVKGYMAWDCVLGNSIGVLIALTLPVVVGGVYVAKQTQGTMKSYEEETQPLIGSQQ